MIRPWNLRWVDLFWLSCGPSLITGTLKREVLFLLLRLERDASEELEAEEIEHCEKYSTCSCWFWDVPVPGKMSLGVKVGLGWQPQVSRTYAACQQLEWAWKQIFSLDLQRGVQSQQILHFGLVRHVRRPAEYMGQNSDLQNCEKINWCCFKWWNA